MKCREFEDRLHSLLDDRQSPEADPQLVAHAATCEPCRRLLIGQRLLLAGLRRGVMHSSGNELAQKVVAGYQAEPAEAVVLEGLAGRRTWQVLAWLAATAAALAIAVSIYVASQPGRANVAVSSPSENRVASENRVPSVGPQRPDRDIAHSDPRPPSGSVRRAPTLGAFQLLPRGGGYGVALADMATSSLPEAVERMEEVERYAPGIRPIRVSFAMLWNALWRSIPGLGSSESDPKAWHGRMDVRRLV